MPGTDVATSRPPARRRLLDAAGELFYTRGINATGVDAVIEAADVARMTFYKQFGGKNGLVAAYLEERDARWQATLAEVLEAAGDDPRTRLLAVFDALGQWMGQQRFRGCSFVNAAAELSDADHPAHAVIRTHKLAMRDLFHRLAEESGHDRPAVLADQLLLLYEGALTNTALGVVDDAVGKARAAAEELIGRARGGRGGRQRS